MKKLRKAKIKRRSTNQAKPGKAKLKKIVAASRARRKSFVERLEAGRRIETQSGNLFLSAVLIAGVFIGAALSLFFPLEVSEAAPATISIAASREGLTVVEEELPFGEIHWHAKLKIIAHASELLIPAGIGITEGSNIDNDASGVPASPIHTHGLDGVLHVEVKNPRENPEMLSLGYFFNRVWGKSFGSECVLEYCNGAGGRVKMFVNGKESKQFGEYSIKDGDEIIVSYELEN